tara:strand:- start:2643 stop:3515 length:873 start_codon:yes stop_codon:yes gene_type:complete
MEYLWIYLCVGASFFAALAWGLNGVFKAHPVRLGFYRSLFVTILLSPVLLIVDLPKDASFYWGFALVGVFGVLADMLFFNVVKHYKGSGPTRVLNLRVPLTVIAGWVLFPGSWDVVSSQGLTIELAIIGCLLVSLGALFFMTKNPVATKVLYLMAGPIAIYVSIDLLTKWLFTGKDLATSATILSIWVVALAMLVTAYFSALVTKTPLVDKNEKTIKFSFIIMLSWLGVMVCKQLAMFYIPNPGYYALFIGLSCLWIMAYHKIKREKDESSPLAGMLLLLATIILTLIVS